MLRLRDEQSVTEKEIRALNESLRKHLGHLWEEKTAWEFKSNGLYRGIFATRDIQLNEVIFRDIPIVVGPPNPSDSVTCVVCLRRLQAENVCPKGCSLSVCSECVGTEGHEPECGVLREWKPKNPQKLSVLSVRMLAAVRGLFISRDSLELIEMLQQNMTSDMDRQFNEFRAEFKNFPVDPLTIKRLRQILAAIRTNAFKFHVNWEDDDSIPASGLYPLSSFLNHQCTPNTRRVVASDFMQTVLAAQSIARGEEILTTYTQLLWCTSARRMHLAMTKQFLCRCTRCSDNTESGAMLSAAKCPNRECGNELILPLNPLDFASSWNCTRCQQTFSSSIMLRSQDFAANLVRGFWQSKRSFSEVVDLIEKRLKRIVPESSQYVVEMKLSFIWKFGEIELEEGII